MLVLSRKTGEQIVIDGDIVVTILAIRGGRVRIGFAAPPAVGIRRAELALRDATVRAATDDAFSGLAEMAG